LSFSINDNASILLVINSVEKIILGLETFYDVLTSVEKIGLVTDMEIEDTENNTTMNYQEMFIELEEVSYKLPKMISPIIEDISIKIRQGDHLHIFGTNQSGIGTLFRILAGVQQPDTGHLYVNDGGYNKLGIDEYRSNIKTYIHGESLFEGSLLDNITLGNPLVTQNDIRWAIESMHLSQFLKGLEDGIDTLIQPEGKNLPASIVQRIILARCIVTRPLVLLLEHTIDQIDDELAKDIIDFLMSEKHKWTIIVSSKNSYWKQKCNHAITLKAGKIIDEVNK
jgi:ABC-type bacteriocin/lantibiotic exporter with double-glycine peptidase domain